MASASSSKLFPDTSKNAKSVTGQSQLTIQDPYTSPHLPSSSKHDPPVDIAQGPLSQVSDTLTPLVTILRNLYLGGHKTPLRSMVGEKLSTHYQDVYKNAGVAGFSGYISMAEKERLVQLGGTGGKAWIILHPDLRP